MISSDNPSRITADTTTCSKGSSYSLPQGGIGCFMASSGFWTISATLRSPSIRRIRAAHRRRAIAWSERSVLFATTRATVQGRAGVGLRRDPPAFPGARGRFTHLNDERVGPAPPDGGLDLPSSARFQPAFSSLRRLRS